MVQNRDISVTEVHKVHGPLIIEEQIDGSLVYEMLISSKRVAIGSLTDVGFNRSFPNPEDVAIQEGHYFVQLPTFEFYARVPIKDLSSSQLSKIEIVVYRVKSPIAKPVGDKSLSLEFGNELREISRLKGINIRTLSKQSRADIRNISLRE
ncbi:MAG: hypothetical protein ACRD97_11475 [Nitrososphaeraceae archaeon]